MGELDGESVAAFLRGALDDPEIVVDGVVRLSGGASRETFALTEARPGHAARALVLQRVRPGALSATFSMEAEARLLAAARAHGVPAPEVVAATDDPSVAGAPCMVVSRIDGETIARKILRDDRFAPARSRLVAQCAAALAATHRVPVAEVPALRAQDPLAVVLSLLDSLGEPHPAFELAIRWLRANQPEVGEPVVVHGDFRLGNLIVDETGLVAVIDWELAHLGDPMEDLGWFCNRAWRFGETLPVAGVGTYDELCDAYEQAGGGAVDRAALHWWEVLGSLRWGAICILQCATHLTGASRSVELATIGRRVCETEHDLLDLIGVPRSSTPGETGAEAPGSTGEAGPAEWSLHGRPTAAELVEAVREFLEHDVLAATGGRVQFHTRVAINALGMVGRELVQGDGPRAAHGARLAALGVADDAALAAAIRAGALDDRIDEVGAAVRASVTAKLAVANPGY